MNYINALKQALKKNQTMDTISRIVCYPLFALQYRKSTKETEKRKQECIEERYYWIRELKDKFKGERCFVVATGPSLTTQDLNLIKKEYSFGMNSCILALKNTEWRPNFYAIQDEYVYQKLENKVFECSAANNLDEIWISNNVAKQFILPSHFKIFPLHYLDHKMYHKKGYGKFRFSDDCYSCIYDGYSVTFSILQMACYMGFKEIYLLGCDCNYNQEKTHFVEYGHKDPKAAIMGDKMIQGHFEFKKFADSHDIKVVNCTRGGMLEVYPRRRLEDVLVMK